VEGRLSDEPRAEKPQTEEFGTGLRAHLGRVAEPEETRPEEGVESKPDTTATQELETEAAALDERRRELNAWREALVNAEGMLRDRERRLAALGARLDEEEKQLTERQSALAAKEQEVEAAPAEPRPTGVGSARAQLRQRVEERVDLVWQAFEEALGATLPDGRPDVELRFAAARALLTEAYGGRSSEEGRGDAAADAPTLEDELARLRERKRENQQGM
jgi:hypothetical protein